MPRFVLLAVVAAAGNVDNNIADHSAAVIPLSGSGWTVFSKPVDTTKRKDTVGFVSVPASVPGDIHDDLER